MSEENGDRLHQYSVRLRLDQIDFLRTLKNASQFIREAIDTKRLEVEEPRNKALLLDEDIKRLEIKRSLFKDRLNKTEEKLEHLDLLRERKPKYEAMLEVLPSLRVECEKAGDIVPGGKGIYAYSGCTVKHPTNPKYYIYLRNFVDHDEAREAAERIIKNGLSKLETLEREGEELIRKMIDILKKVVQDVDKEIKSKKQELLSL